MLQNGLSKEEVGEDSLKKTPNKSILEFEPQIQAKTYRDHQIPLPQIVPKRVWRGKLVERLSKPETEPRRTENNGPGP